MTLTGSNLLSGSNLKMTGSNLLFVVGMLLLIRGRNDIETVEKAEELLKRLNINCYK